MEKNMPLFYPFRGTYDDCGILKDVEEDNYRFWKRTNAMMLAQARTDHKEWKEECERG